MINVEEVKRFAINAHCGDTRKFTNMPYAVHIMNVANMVGLFESAPEAVAIAYLHDTIEDAKNPIVMEEDVRSKFGDFITKQVLSLTNVGKKYGNRAQRKEADNYRLSMASGIAQTVKLADIMDNVPSMLLHKPDFGLRYLNEKIATLEVLDRAHPKLYSLVHSYLHKLRKERK